MLLVIATLLPHPFQNIVMHLTLEKQQLQQQLTLILKKLCLKPTYPGDTRPEFKMWGGASKSVFVLVLKICQHQFASKTLSC